MENETNSLLNVPITEAERRASRSRRGGPGTWVPTPPSSRHERDRQLNSQIGRFSSLRHPGEQYDDPEQPHNYSGSTTRPSTLPGIDEGGSHYSDHDDEEPIFQPSRATNFSRPSKPAYAALPQPPTPPSRQVPDQPGGISPRFWQPIWLRKLSLTLVILLFLTLIVVLVVTCNNADNNDGYHMSSSAQHYAWTYVPTLIMVLVVALWRQIDFHTKVLTPWKSLALGPESPFDTVLIDYISNFQIMTFLAAFKRLHVPVLITIVGLVMSLGLTVVSTGLFYPRTKDFIDGFPTVITSFFDLAALDPAIFVGVGSFSNSSVYTYTQNEVNGLGAQLGIESTFAYVLPTLTSLSKKVPSNITYTTTVDTFIPSISCRAANVTLNGEATIETLDIHYNSTDTPYGTPSNLTLTINEASLCGAFPELTFLGRDPLHYIVSGETLESRSQELYCNNDTSTDPILLLTLVEVQYTQDLLTNVTRREGGELPIALNTSRSVSRMINILCQADYTLSQVNLTNNTVLEGVAGVTLTNLPDANYRTLEGLSPANMTTIYNAMLGSPTGLFIDSSDADFIRTPAFDLLAWTATEGIYDDLFDETTLQNAAEKIYIGTMPHFAAKHLVSNVPAESASTGPIASVSWSEERLFTNWTPVILLITGLGIMALLTVALIILLPENVVPRDPNSIAAAATTLSRSSELNRLLRKLQSPQHKGIAAAFNGYEVGTAIAVDEDSGARSFKIHVTEGRPQRDVEEIVPNNKFWNPVWSSLPVLAATFSVPLIMLALLEIFQHRSDTNDGLWSVPDDRGTLIASHFVPALATLLVGAIINNLEFYISLFSPWSQLFKTNARAEHSIIKNVVGHSAVSALWVSGKARQWGAHLAALATIFTALLTVIVSGLYVVKDFDTDGPTRSFSRLDRLNLDRIVNYTVSYDGGAGSMFDLIQGGSAFPAGTLDEYAFPRIALGNLSTDLPSGSKFVGYMEGTMQAYRGNITCDAPAAYDVDTIDTNVRITASYNLPDSCLNAVDSLNSSILTFSTDFAATGDSPQFGAKLFDLRFGTNSSHYGHVGEGNSSLVGDNPAVGCPSLAFIWGNFQLQNDNQSAVNVAVCYQKIEIVDVNVTMQQGTTYFGSRTFVDGKSNKTLTNPAGTTDVFDFRLQSNLARQLGDYIGPSPNIDPFFQSMISGTMNLDLDRFSSNRSMAIMAISHTYRLYMAQVFNALLREKVSNSKLMARQTTDISASLRTTITTARLVQDKPSKIILQVFLGLSALLIMGGYVLTKMRNILPCNPCSIAGIMSLLAGSDLCYQQDDGICECCGKVRRSFRSTDGRVQTETIHADDNEHADEARSQVIRQGAEWMDDKSFARVFEGRTYSLGWWEPISKFGKIKRYGVDIGSSLDGKGEAEWYLGHRKNSETFEIFSEQNLPEVRGRTRALSDVNERGSYARQADLSPGEAHEMTSMTPRGSLGLGERHSDD